MTGDKPTPDDDTDKTAPAIGEAASSTGNGTPATEKVEETVKTGESTTSGQSASRTGERIVTEEATLTSEKSPSSTVEATSTAEQGSSKTAEATSTTQQSSSTIGETTSTAEQSSPTTAEANSTTQGSSSLTEGGTSTAEQKSSVTANDIPTSEQSSSSTTEGNSSTTGRRAWTAAERPTVSSTAVYGEIERQLSTLISLENQEAAKNMFNDLLRMGRDGYQFGIDLISELSTELTGVKSLQMIPKGPLELDVDMKRKKDLVLKCKYPIAPLIDVHAVTFGEDLNFGALVDRDKKALKMNIRKGLKLTIKFGPIEQTVDIKGTAMLSRNEKKQLVLSTTTTIPGTDSPITISIPLTMLFQQRKNLI
ncbi:MAG: hypothetical protein K2X93_07355 [Candidatus Obscuribacterales bacterium]|nr:hypothetical protein [Candidatus Obscuribacterales bacterium]